MYVPGIFGNQSTGNNLLCLTIQTCNVKVNVLNNLHSLLCNCNRNGCGSCGTVSMNMSFIQMPGKLNEALSVST